MALCLASRRLPHVSATVGGGTRHFASIVSERMSQLERAAVIAGYSVKINWGGYTQKVYVSITAVADHDLADIMCRLWVMPEVREVTLITGDLDLLVNLKMYDQEHLRGLLMHHIWQIVGLQGASIQISMAAMPAKRFADAPLEQIEQQLGRADS